MGWFPDLHSNNTDSGLIPAAGAVLGGDPSSREWLSLSGRRHRASGTGGWLTGGVSAGLKAAKEFTFPSTGWCNSGKTLPFPPLMKTKSSQVSRTWILKPSLDRAFWNANLTRSTYCSCGFGCSTRCFLSHFRSSISDEGEILAVSAWAACQTAAASCCSKENLILLPAPLPGHRLLHTRDLLAASPHPEDSYHSLKKPHSASDESQFIRYVLETA